MAVPTRVIENGQWVTRLLDPYQILAQNRSQQEQEALPLVQSTKAPHLALLTQTLIHSPVVKWIIPARIRHRTKNDVLFISEDRVQIKEAHPDYTLESVLVKNDFDSPIRSAKIFGLSRKPTKPEFVIKKEESNIWQDDMDNVDSERDGDGNALMLDDFEESVEGGNTELNCNDSHEDGVSRCANLYHPTARQLPPQILITVLESAKIVFLYTVSGPSHCVHLLASQKPLPYATSRLHQLGEHLVVDPNSRAFAIGAYETTFYLYALKPRRRLEAELKESLVIIPVEAERAFTVDGTILHMEFLHPLEEESNHVLLLLIVSKNGMSKLVWYEWNTAINLHDAQLKPGTYALPQKYSLPLLLAPLLAFNAFLIVTESHACICRDILTGTPDIHDFALPNLNQQEEETVCSKRKPVWIQWARPMRSLSGRTLPMKSDDNIYLCREDGFIQYIDIKYSNPYLLDLFHDAGKLGVGVSGSFAVIDLGPSADDLLIAGGDSGAGGYWRFSPRKAAERLSIQPNWAPLHDSFLNAVPKKGIRHDRGMTEARGHQQLFVCTGRVLNGSVAALHYGIYSSPPLESIDLGDLTSDTILDLWALRSTEDISYVLIAHPTRTSLLRLQKHYDPELLDDTAGFDLDSRTIAALSTDAGLAFQVTSRFITATSIHGSNDSRISWQIGFGNDDDEALVASIATAGSRHHLAVALRKHSGFFLQFGLLGRTFDHLGDYITLVAQPTCISMHIGSEHLLILIANALGAIEIFGVTWSEASGVLHKVNGWRFPNTFEICDSLTVLNFDERKSSFEGLLVVCGLRNGQVHTLKFQRSQSDTRDILVLSEQISIGHTSVIVKTHPSKRGCVVLHCDKRLFMLEYPVGVHNEFLGALKPIHLNDICRSDMQCNEVFAFTDLGTTQASKQAAADLLIAVEQGVIHSIKLNKGEIKHSLLQSCSSGTLSRITYSERLIKIVALFSETLTLRIPKDDGSRIQIGRRAYRPSVVFLDVDDINQVAAGDVDVMHLEGAADKDQECPRHYLNYKPGEKFLGVVEWLPEIDGNKYHMLIFNTIIKDRQRPSSGRLLLYSVAKAENGNVRLSLKKAIDSQYPVYSVISHPKENSIVYCSGNELTVLELDISPSGIKFSTPAKIMMRSAGRHVTMRDTFIYVSTANESLQVYRYLHRQLMYWHGDTVARNTICHLHDFKSDLIFISDMSGSVTGLWQPATPQANNALTTVFEGRLPQAITRLTQVSRPSWTEDVLIPGGAIRLQEEARDCTSALEVNSSTTFDCRSKAFIGTSTDGTVTQLLVLEKGWRLLKFVQNMCERHRSICPFMVDCPKSRLEPTADNPRFMHISGDVLNRLYEKGAARMLTRMLDEPFLRGHREEQLGISGSVEERWKRFIELSAEVLGERNMQGWGREKVLEEVVRWMKYVMRSAL